MTYPQAERKVLATEHVNGISANMEDGVLSKVTQEQAYVCTVSVSGSGDDGASYDVHVTLVLDLHSCPDGTPRPSMSDSTKTTLTDGLKGLRVLDALALADPEAALDTERAALDGTYGDVPDPLLPSMDSGEAFETLDIDGRVGEYCIIDTGSDQYANDRHGYICRVGDDLYGRLVFRTVPDVDPVYNRPAYGIQAWLCCETREDTLAPED